MAPRLKEAKHVSSYVIWLNFADGNEGEADLRDDLAGPAFKPLKDMDYFRKFRVDPELHTLAWPNGADFSPEFLYEKVRIPA